MPCCAFLRCTNTSKTKNKAHGITFHAFPNNERWRQQWLVRVREQRRELNWIPTANSRICSKHFKLEDIYTTNKGYKKILKSAVPCFRIKESEAATSSTENDGKTIEFPDCDECQKPVDARELYRCVQCPLVVMCADCGRNNAHALHCVLRMPSLQIYNKVEYLFELLTEVFHKKLSEKDDVGDNDDDDGDDSNDDDKDEEMEQELEISVHQKDDSENQNQTVESAMPGPSKHRKSSASTFLSSWRDEVSAPEPPDEAMPTSHIKTEPDTDPLACPSLFNILHAPTDEPKPKKRRTIMENAPKKDYAANVNTDKIRENIRDEEHEEVVEVKLETLDSGVTLVDTEKYASYGSHRAGNTDLQ